jgi:hypothetical protein
MPAGVSAGSGPDGTRVTDLLGVDVDEDEGLYMTHTYDAPAADCDWMFNDQTLARGAAIDQPATARLLGRLPRAWEAITA